MDILPGSIVRRVGENRKHVSVVIKQDSHNPAWFLYIARNKHGRLHSQADYISSHRMMLEVLDKSTGIWHDLYRAEREAYFANQSA